MKVTYLGTTMLLFDDGKDQLLFDCHVTRPSIPTYLFGRLKTDRKTADRVIREFHMDRLRGIFISHSHHDHVMDAPYFARRCRADLYGSASALNVARGGRVNEKRLHCFGDPVVIGSFRISVLPSVHSKPNFFNNDLGQTIDEPLVQPAYKKAYKEGGSYDFLVEHEGKRILIRPSYNYLEGQLDDVRADVLYLGVAGLSKDSADHKARFWAETVEKVKPKLIIPLHWDNFFAPLYGPIIGTPKLFEFTGKTMHELAAYCGEHDINCVVQMPLTSMEL